MPTLGDEDMYCSNPARIAFTWGVTASWASLLSKTATAMTLPVSRVADANPRSETRVGLDLPGDVGEGSNGCVPRI